MAHDPAIDVEAAVALADGAYAPIHPFSAWAPDVDLTAWQEAAAGLADARALAEPAEVDKALHEHLRAAAVDTGAIEGLYTSDRGFTLSLAREQISLDQAEVEKGPDFRRNYEAQLAGFEMVLDVATSARPLTETLIRQIHEITCAGQLTYRVLTPAGVQERPLVLGSYKTDPNHVQLADGSFHPYAPVHEVAEEVRRLVVELQSAAFGAAHPVIQASYAHHAFTSIHPFADGNGRVARLLAATYLLRAASIPLWIETTDRGPYLDALAAADRGDHAVFVGLIERVSLRLLREMTSVLRAQPAVRAKQSRDAMRDGRAALADAVFDPIAAKLGPPFRSVRSGDQIEEADGGLEMGNPADRRRVRFAEDGTCWLGAAIDWAAPSHSRFVVLSGSMGGSVPDPLEIHEMFDEADVLPELSPSALRRIEAIVDRIVAAATRT